MVTNDADDAIRRTYVEALNVASAEIASLQRHAREVEGAHADLQREVREQRQDLKRLAIQRDQLDDTLRLRTAALARVVAQLEEVRKLHVRNGSNRCRRCREIYPCETARAAGIEDTETPAARSARHAEEKSVREQYRQTAERAAGVTE